MNDFSIPKISDDVEILPFDKKNYLVQHKEYKYQLKVNTLLYELLVLIDGNSSIESITNKVQEKYPQITKDQITSIVYGGKLVECGIIISDKKVSPRRSDSYLKFRITLLKYENTKWVISVFSKLFYPLFFWSTLLFMILFVTYIYISFVNMKTIFYTITTKNSIFIYSLFYLSTLLHELGHSSACKCFGAKPGNIGFGIYLVMPVFYADVSDAWRVSSKNRVIIDLAGLYMELLLCVLLCTMYLVLDNSFLLCCSILLVFRTYGNLNPLLRFDGYWALSDALNIPNLREKSFIKSKEFFGYIFKKRDKLIYNKKDYFILMYGLCSHIMLILFFSTLIIYNPNIILLFPENFLHFVVNVLKFSFTSIENFRIELFSLITPFFLYLMIYRLVHKYVLVKLKYFFAYTKIGKMLKL